MAPSGPLKQTREEPLDSSAPTQAAAAEAWRDDRNQQPASGEHAASRFPSDGKVIISITVPPYSPREFLCFSVRGGNTKLASTSSRLSARDKIQCFISS